MTTKLTLDGLSVALVGVRPRLEVVIQGEWSSKQRRTYERVDQAGSGVGPLVDVVDRRWSGLLSCATPITGVAFLCTPREVFWAKAGAPSSELPVEISMHARADHVDGRATFSGNLMGSTVPGVPIAFADGMEASCSADVRRFTTGTPHVLATAGSVSFAVLLLPGTAIKMGRKRLWHLRDELAAALPDSVRLLLTRGRTGTLDAREQADA